ncbi:MAG TPA: aminotransferase [Acetobacteraceae bacterium]|jgi:isopenicillin-N epimerase|nr:aminotransferase [Acetobacteraceae bacterium]
MATNLDFPSDAEWDLDPAFLTVNHGSFGATPRTVIAAQRAWQDRMERQPSRFMNTVYPGAIRKAASALGIFLNADPDHIVFVDNATTGCNAVIKSLSLREGDQITILSHAYGAVHNAIRYVAERAGARIVQATIPFPDPTEDALIAAVTATLGSRTKLAVIDHITSGSAIVLPIKRIVAACHAAGVRVLVDGAHAPGQIDLDLEAIGADWYVGNCHKWLCAPKGCAFLHAKPPAQAGLHPGTISHGYGQGFLAEFDWTGTTDPSRFLSIEAALDFHQRLGGASLRARNKALAAQGAALIAQRLNTNVGTTGATAGAMATIRLPVDDPTPEHALRIRRKLMEAGTDAPVHALDGALWLRISAFAYNELDDYVRLAALVPGVLRDP